MSNFREAYNALLALIDSGYTFDAAQEQVSLDFNLDETDGEGLAEEYFTTHDEILDFDSHDDMSAVEADSDTLRMAGWGTDEDYGFFGGDDER
jgi:hypothetical protein